MTNEIPIDVVPLSEAEIEAGEAWNAGAYDRAVAEVELQRQIAYQREADPLYFQWQAGESTQEIWQAKRAEIRELYPYPEPPK